MLQKDVEYVVQKEYEHSSSGYVEGVEDYKVFSDPFEAMEHFSTLPECSFEYNDTSYYECVVTYRVIVRYKK